MLTKGAVDAGGRKLPIRLTGFFNFLQKALGLTERFRGKTGRVIHLRNGVGDGVSPIYPCLLGRVLFHRIHVLLLLKFLAQF